jgi:hypothetical protein
VGPRAILDGTAKGKKFHHSPCQELNPDHPAHSSVWTMTGLTWLPYLFNKWERIFYILCHVGDLLCERSQRKLCCQKAVMQAHFIKRYDVNAGTWESMKIRIRSSISLINVSQLRLFLHWEGRTSPSYVI